MGFLPHTLVRNVTKNIKIGPELSQSGAARQHMIRELEPFFCLRPEAKLRILIHLGFSLRTEAHLVFVKESSQCLSGLIRHLGEGQIQVQVKVTYAFPLHLSHKFNKEDKAMLFAWLDGE